MGTSIALNSSAYPFVSTIVNAVLVGCDNNGVDPSFRAFRGAVRVDTNFPYFWTATGGVYNSQTSSTPPYAVEFMTDAPVLEIKTWGTASKYQLFVDGTAQSATLVSGPPGDGNAYLIKVDFGGVRLARRVTLRTDSNFKFGGIYVGPNDTVWASSSVKGARVIVAGDSFTDGTAADNTFQGYAHVCGDALGWDVWSTGCAGAGYVNPATQGDLTLRQRIANDVYQWNPNVLVIALGIDDNNNPYTPTEVATELAILYPQIKTNLPNTRVIVVGPWNPRTFGGAPGSGSNLDQIRLAIQSAASSAGFTFIDPFTWFTGTGRVGSTSGTGNSDLYVSADGTHPTTTGHDYLGHRLAQAIRAAR